MSESNNKKRLLFINYEYPPLGGGGGHACQQIAQEMAALGHEIHVLTSCYKGLPSSESLNGVQIRRIPTLRSRKDKCSVFEMFVFLLSSLIFAPIQYFRIKPTALICFFSIPCGPAGLVLNLLFGIPYVIALRGGDVPGFLPESLARFHSMTNWLTRWIWRRASSITANSKGLTDLGLRFMPNVRIEIIPNGVDQRFVFDRSKISPSKSTATLQVITVGRLNEQKKVRRLIEAFGRLSHKHAQSIVLKIIGDGPQRSELEELAHASHVLNTSVFFEGWKDRDELIQIYRQSDVLVLASDYEGMPNVILEAMASSLAIVATNAPGTVELVKQGENGFLIDRNSLDQFDSRLIELRDNPAILKRMQTNSHELAKCYSWKQSAESYLSHV